jgi:hypothetical protein
VPVHLPIDIGQSECALALAKVGLTVPVVLEFVSEPAQDYFELFGNGRT